MQFSPTFSLLNWRDKLRRLATLKAVQERAEDFVRNLPFHLRWRERAERLRIFQQCRTVEDYHAFISASPRIAPHQLKSEIIGFVEFARASSPVNVCEIGTAQGGTSFMLSQSIPSVEWMLGIDLFVRNQASLRYFSRPGQELHFRNRSSYDPATVEMTRRLLGTRKLDLLFIDGDHAYDGVKEDFLLFKSFVREGGIIAFHDIVPDYKTRLNRDTGRWASDVPKFWERIKSSYEHHEFIDDPEQDSLGIGCILYSSRIAVPAGL